MNDVSSIASALLNMSQSQNQTQISASMMKMSIEAEQAVADMLMQNALQIAAQMHSAGGGLIDTFA